MGIAETPKTPVKAAPKTAAAPVAPSVQEGIGDAARQFAKGAVLDRNPYLKMAFTNPYNLSLFGGVLAAAGLTLNPVLAVVALGLEGLWLLHAPDNERLKHILEDGHFDSVGVCLDLGHAHLTVGVAEAIATFADRIVSVHMHDNHGLKDEHLWPGDGDIDWPAAAQALNALPAPPVTVLELSQSLGEPAAELPARIPRAFALLDYSGSPIGVGRNQ